MISVNLPKIIAICGPTSIGKTKIAEEICQKYHGEMVSFDSRQVYKYLNIGTGKEITNTSQKKFLKLKNLKNNPDLKKFSLGFFLLNNIPLWLTDIVNPDQMFSVSAYQKLANIAISDILQREKLPVMVGGTGLYLKAIIDGIETINIPPDYELRKKLNLLDIGSLQEKLQKLSPQKWVALNSSDRQNPRRLIRAIEISLNPKKHNLKNDFQTAKKYKFLQIGLIASREIIYQKIDLRIAKRIKQGLLSEIEFLINKGYSWNLPSFSGLGYKVWQKYFEKKETLSEALNKWKNQEHAYARRQLTWFKKDKRIIWFDNQNANYSEKIFSQVTKFLLNHND